MHRRSSWNTCVLNNGVLWSVSHTERIAYVSQTSSKGLGRSQAVRRTTFGVGDKTTSLRRRTVEAHQSVTTKDHTLMRQDTQRLQPQSWENRNQSNDDGQPFLHHFNSMILTSTTHTTHSLQSGIIHACTALVLASTAHAPHKVGMNYACSTPTALNLALALSAKPQINPPHTPFLFKWGILPWLLSSHFFSALLLGSSRKPFMLHCPIQLLLL